MGPNNRKIPPDEGRKSCDRSTTNKNAAMCIIECNDRKGAKIVRSITNCQLQITSGSSSEVEVVDARLEAVTTGVRDVKCNTVISIPSVFGEELFSAAYPANVVMSLIPRDCKILRKSDALPELLNLKFVEANYKGDPQMRAIKEFVEAKDPDFEQKLCALSAYLGQHTHVFHVRKNCLWVDERLVIPILLRKAVVNRIHCSIMANVFDAVRNVWFPYIHRSLVAAADDCKECTEA